MVHVGLSGFSYKPWQGEGRFYPPGLKQSEFLKYYSGRYDSVEMDGTWYRMPTEEAVQSWLQTVPQNFTFAFKAHRNITHIKRLKDEAVENLAFQVKRLAPIYRANKCAPLLLQLPPNLKRDDERLITFLDSMPREIENGPAIRYAMEFRNDTWHDDAIQAILESRGVAWAMVETDDSAPQKRLTAEFIYARLRKSEYSTDELIAWADYFSQSGKECFVYCKHEDDGSPWIWADSILTRLSNQNALA